MNLGIAVLSRPGVRATNEDACGWWQAGGPACCVLSDGAGGHGGGDLASQLSVRSVLQGFAERPHVGAPTLSGLLTRANQAVLDAQRAGGVAADMRATLVVLTIDPPSRRAIWAHAGDSRLYWLRDGNVLWRSRDHTLFQSLLDAGFATEDQRERHAGVDMLTTALGSADAFRPEVAGEPVELRDGDAFLLCSDGLWRAARDELIVRTLEFSASPQDWLDQLAEHVVACAAPSQDNYSALAVWCGSTAS